MQGTKKAINILGIRGIPAAHGGFETFAGHLAPYLRDRGWQVNVYCQLEPQADGTLRADYVDDYEGIRRIFLGSKGGSGGSIAFDWRCVQHARSRPGVNLVLGYNTALFTTFLRLSDRPVVMNMDGVEWKRAKWSLPIKAWFYLNEFAGAHLASVPIADHPEIARHLRRHGCNRAEVIPYGSECLAGVDSAPVEALGLVPGQYFVSIARLEPENSVLEIVRAFSSRPRASKLVVLGRFDEGNAYHLALRQAASEDVVFPGAIYDKKVVSALRVHCKAYMHGHQVGGTNPSLVEALGAGNAIIAHDNRFNRWVAGDEQLFFTDSAALDIAITRIEDGAVILDAARQAATRRHAAFFSLDTVNSQYEAVLEGFLP